MLSQLDSMIEGSFRFVIPRRFDYTDACTEERLAREDFNAEHGQYLPEDVCLCIQNPPTRWTVGPWGGEVVEVLPVIAPDLLEEVSQCLISRSRAIERVGFVQAKQRIASAGGTLAASQSL